MKDATNGVIVIIVATVAFYSIMSILWRL